MAQSRNIKYINKDFADLKSTLINYSKTYFPTTYTDFSETSPGIMFMEMAAYVGDVLSFYQDNQIQETFTQFARNTQNLFDLAYVMGYKPQVTGVASVNLDFYQTVPALGSGGQYAPDYDYALFVAPNVQVNSLTNTNVNFLTEDPIDFTVSSSQDPTEVTVYEVDGSNNPQSYLLKKTRKAISATIKTTTINAGGSPQEFFTTNVSDTNIIGILDIVDSDGNIWYEVPYLAEEMVYDSIKNTNPNDPNNYQNEGEVPYLLKLKQTQRRFATRFINASTLQIQFGAGTTQDEEEEIIPNPDNVGLGLPFEKNKLTAAYSPTNFIFTPSYGIAPTGNLTVRYLVGGGVGANVPANTLTNITQINKSFVKFSSTDPSGLYQSTFDSLITNNPRAASGGRGGDTVEELRQNITSNFPTQNRAITSEDYTIRSLAMPSRYGKIAKIYTEKSKITSDTNTDLYILSYGGDGNLSLASSTLKQNLSTYLSQYRIIGDSISIKDAFIVNIGIDFELITLPNFNNNEVLRKCIIALQNYFNISNWQINQPIIYRELYTILDLIEGVQTIKNIEFSNKVGGDYSQYAYDVKGANINQIIYPSIDPMIFEVKFPNSDIKGKIVNL